MLVQHLESVINISKLSPTSMLQRRPSVIIFHSIISYFLQTPEYYVPHMDCFTEFFCEEPDETVHFSFDYFKTEKDFDRLQIKSPGKFFGACPPNSDPSLVREFQTLEWKFRSNLSSVLRFRHWRRRYWRRLGFMVRWTQCCWKCMARYQITKCWTRIS